MKKAIKKKNASTPAGNKSKRSTGRVAKGLQGKQKNRVVKRPAAKKKTPVKKIPAKKIAKKKAPAR